MNLIEACRSLIACDTTPSRGTVEAARFLKGRAEDAGLRVNLDFEHHGGVEQCNLIARSSGDIPPVEVCLQAHLDTAEAGPYSLWTENNLNPFAATIKDGRLFGLGATDAKIQFLCQIEAARSLRGRNLKIPFVLAATYGGHAGMAGIIKLMRRKKLNAKWACVAAATDSKLMTSSLGVARFQLEVLFSKPELDYRRNHDLAPSSSQSRIFKGDAVAQALNYLAQLPDGVALMDLDGGTGPETTAAHAVLELDFVGDFTNPISSRLARIDRCLREVQADMNTRPHPARVMLNAARTTDAGVSLSGTCRIPARTEEPLVEGWLHQIQNVCSENLGHARLLDYRNGFETKKDSQVVEVASRTLESLSNFDGLHAFEGASEASVLSRLGTECVIWGPGRENDSLNLKDLDAAVEFYRRFLGEFCL